MYVEEVILNEDRTTEEEKQAIMEGEQGREPKWEVEFWTISNSEKEFSDTQLIKSYPVLDNFLHHLSGKF